MSLCPFNTLSDYPSSSINPKISNEPADAAKSVSKIQFEAAGKEKASIY